MAFPDVYPVTQFADILPIEKVTFDVIRFDEFDAKGSGQDLVSDLADPKWTADVLMRSLTNAEARQVSALARKRFGSMLSFMLYDPSNPYPASDPNGDVLDGANWIFVSGAWDDAGAWFDGVSWSATAATFEPTVSNIGADGQSLSLANLPPNYLLTVGDKGQIVYGDDDEFNFYFEFSENIVSNSSGNTTDVQIYPHIPPEIAEDFSVILRKPACKMTFNPGSTFSPGQSSGNRTGGVRFSAIERV